MSFSPRTHLRRAGTGGLALLGATAMTAGLLASAHAAGPTNTAGASAARIQNLNAPADRRTAVPQSRRSAPAATPAVSAWSAIPNYPTAIQDNTVGNNNGTIYSVDGWVGTTGASAATSALYAYTPSTAAAKPAKGGGGGGGGAAGWVKKAAAPLARTNAAGAFIGGKFYVTGGWSAGDVPAAELDIYNPASNTWSTGAALPKPVASAAATVLNGKLYLIGGCNASQCGETSDVEVYDPAANTWSAAANYPTTVDLEACGTVSGAIYCAGGITGVTPLTRSYRYNPAGNAWTPIADLPADDFGAGYSAANGELLVQDGVIDDALLQTNQGWAYSPATNTWTALPNALTAEFRGGSTLGLYLVGGNPDGDPERSLNTAETLPGFGVPSP